MSTLQFWILVVLGGLAGTWLLIVILSFIGDIYYDCKYGKRYK